MCTVLAIYQVLRLETMLLRPDHSAELCPVNFLKSEQISRVVVVRAFNPITQKAEADGSFQVCSQPGLGQLGLYCVFQDSQRYIVRPFI